jgi:DNA polymerase III epsilon subunit-like protein
MFKRVGDGLYQLCRNINVYTKTNVSKFISAFTGINQGFLNKYGCEPEETIQLFKEFCAGVSLDDILFVSHGAHQDTKILIDNDFPMNGAHYICTHGIAKKVLDRAEHLTLGDIAEECGYLFPAHNAYNDALATAVVLSFLLKRRGEMDNE